VTETVMISIDRKNLKINVDKEEKDLILKAAELLDTYAKSIQSPDPYIRILQAALYYAMESERLRKEASSVDQSIERLVSKCEEFSASNAAFERAS
jgi:cell division protein ZapA (FtsZ GTPase activity inhibitor)